MRTIQQLRDAGFTVQGAEDAAGCTEVLSDDPFWHVGRQFLDSTNTTNTMLEVQERIRPADPHAGGYRLVIAGRYADDAILPSHLMDAKTVARLDAAHDKWETASAAVDAARALYREAIFPSTSN